MLHAVLFVVGIPNQLLANQGFLKASLRPNIKELHHHHHHHCHPDHNDDDNDDDGDGGVGSDNK